MCFRAVFLLLSLVVGALSLGGCTPQAEPVFKEEFVALGTLVQVSIYGVSEAKAQQAFTAAIAQFKTMDEAWHPSKPGPLARLNQALAHGQQIPLDPALSPLVALGTEFSRQTGGLFNPAVGGMVHLWGFDQDTLPTGPPPAPERIIEWLAKKPRMEDLVVKDGLISSSNAAVQLDFGGLAQGYGVDRVIDQFKRLGIENAIINCSGDIRAIGRKGDKSWRVGIRDPFGAGVLASLDLHAEESIVTAGDYERYYEFQGVRYHHIMDPRSGRPSRGTTSATAIHRQGVVADAVATALLVAGASSAEGRKEGSEILRRTGVTEAMWVATDGTVYVTPAMAARLHWEGSPSRVVTTLSVSP